MNITDSKLEKLIQNIKESKNSNNKLIYYKKANARLDEIKITYNKLSLLLKQKSKKSDNKSDNKISIEKIITELDKINEKMNSEKCDMLELIDNYIQYKSLLENLETETEKIKNEIFK